MKVLISQEKAEQANTLFDKAENIEGQLENIYLSADEYDKLSKEWEDLIKQAKQLLK